MCALNLRRGYRPTGGLEEPFFRAERVASYKPPGLAGDDFGVGLAVPPRQIHYNTWLFSLKQLVNVPSWHTTWSASIDIFHYSTLVHVCQHYFMILYKITAPTE